MSLWELFRECGVKRIVFRKDTNLSLLSIDIEETKIYYYYTLTVRVLRGGCYQGDYQ